MHTPAGPRMPEPNSRMLLGSGVVPVPVVVVPAQLSITLSSRVTAPLSAQEKRSRLGALSRAGFNDLSRRSLVLELNVSGQRCTTETERTLELRKKSGRRRNWIAAVVQHGHGNSSGSDWAI